jgi:hypothetical protein
MSRWCPMARIEAIEVVRETEKTVTIDNTGHESRESKRSEFQNWFDTWEDAHAFLLTIQQLEVTALRLKLESANETLGRIKGMKQ